MTALVGMQSKTALDAVSPAGLAFALSVFSANAPTDGHGDGENLEVLVVKSEGCLGRYF
jgi:hypothetical protein